MSAIFNLPVENAKWVEIYLLTVEEELGEIALQCALEDYHKGAYNE